MKGFALSNGQRKSPPYCQAIRSTFIFNMRDQEGEPLKFLKASYLASSASSDQFPDLSEPEIAFVGRSNVGKSSLINHLTQTKHLAHVSEKPGKTQLIHFFPSTDRKLVFVDLPGYGFAKAPKTKRAEWGDLIQSYLESRKNLALILLLIDLRHLPTKDDIAFAKWAVHFKKRFMAVFTKADKLTESEQKKRIEENTRFLKEAIEGAPFDVLPYSIKEGKGRLLLTKEIEKIVS